MTCNLVNNKIELKQCFDIVTNSNNGKHWYFFYALKIFCLFYYRCIFEYDKNGDSNIIKVGSTGGDIIILIKIKIGMFFIFFILENGLEEMLQFFNNEKVQYGFATQKCVSQFKTFLIHWVILNKH